MEVTRRGFRLRQYKPKGNRTCCQAIMNAKPQKKFVWMALCFSDSNKERPTLNGSFSWALNHENKYLYLQIHWCHFISENHKQYIEFNRGTQTANTKTQNVSSHSRKKERFVFLCVGRIIFCGVTNLAGF